MRFPGDTTVHRTGLGGVLLDWTPRLSLSPSDAIGGLATDVEGDGDDDLLLIDGTGQPSRLFILTD